VWKWLRHGARLINALPKVVFSTSLDAVDWPSASVNARPVVDEYRLTVHPIALGHGSALMHGLPEPQRFELVSSTVYTDGSTLQVLHPAA
jgi:hypothetical protein